MSEVKNILLVGVGGQGTILASKILTSGLMEAGYDVKMSEIHGMSQRGGSVSTQVRYGDKVLSIVVNDFVINPAPVNQGQAEYPEGIIEDLAAKVKVVSLKAGDMAAELGNPKAMNVVLLGALVKAIGTLDDVDWMKHIEKNVKPKFVELNKKAFQAGYDFK